MTIARHFCESSPNPSDRQQLLFQSHRGNNLIPSPKPGGHALKVEASHMLVEALIMGEVSRGDMLRVSGLAERTGRQVLFQLIEEGLLRSDLPKGPVRLAFPTHFASFIFQDLYPG
jgi:hypothetical protein